MKLGFLAASVASAIAIATISAEASPFREAESQLRQAYGSYRAALFATNAGDAEATVAAMSRFDSEWAALVSGWSTTPPPQYEDDPGLVATLSEVSMIITKASERVTEDDLPEAHLTLEGIRDRIGELHLRNGLYSFSDRMNAYHAKMEAVLNKDYGDGGLVSLAGDAAVLSILATDIVAHPAPESAEPGYAALVADFQASVAALDCAVAAGDLDAAKAAIGRLKVPYSKLFLKFG